MCLRAAYQDIPRPDSLCGPSWHAPGSGSFAFRIHGLLSKCPDKVPNEIELSALAATLHSFYTGIENIFKRVAVELDREPVRGDSWHRDLLLRMKTPTARRLALLAEELHDTLNEILVSATFFVTPIRLTSIGRKCLRWCWAWKEHSKNWKMPWMDFSNKPMHDYQSRASRRKNAVTPCD